MKFAGLFSTILLLIVAGVFLLQVRQGNKPLANSPTKEMVQPSKTNPPSVVRSYSISHGALPDIPFVLPRGFTIHVFADGLGSPRDLQFTSRGTLLVSNPSGNEVFALPDANHDGVADTKKIIISGQNHVHGLAFYQGKLYIADVDQVVRYNWDEKTLTATKDKTLFSLPENNDHNNRTLIFNSSGQLFISLGSTCNVCNESPTQGGSVLVSDAAGSQPHVFATGLRNAAFLAINPKTGEVWGTEMGRDYLGDEIPPDEINIVQQGQDYGWPYCYGNKIHDDNFDVTRNHSCTATAPPLYQIPAHSAPLGLVFITSPQFSPDWQGDLLVAYHGSWNRSSPVGYKIVHMKVNGNTITGVSDFLTGFLHDDSYNQVRGRPVDLTFDNQGNLYISDDKTGAIYIVQKKSL